MKRWVCLMLAVCCALCFAGCGEILEHLAELTLPEDFTIPKIDLPEDVTFPEVSIPAVTAPVDTWPNQDVTDPTQPRLPTEPVWDGTVPVGDHSDLYIPGLAVEDVILYFNEVCLDAEFIMGGDPSKLQKWTEPISFNVHGEATEEDMAVLDEFIGWLNDLEGFPGMHVTFVTMESDLEIHFCVESRLIDILGENYRGCDGGVTFWYLNDEIYEGTICIRNDIGQHVRNSVILEELYNGLGPVQDSWLREDSIIYAGYSEPQSLTEIDELILRLLYHPDMKCGMDREQCEAVIRALYY